VSRGRLAWLMTWRSRRAIWKARSGSVTPAANRSFGRSGWEARPERAIAGEICKGNRIRFRGVVVVMPSRAANLAPDWECKRVVHPSRCRSLISRRRWYSLLVYFAQRKPGTQRSLGRDICCPPRRPNRTMPCGPNNFFSESPVA
jgi:hypothetical protein